MGNGQARQAAELGASVELELTPQDGAGRRPGELPVGLVDAGQQHNVGGCVAGREAPPAVGCRAHRALAQELPDQARRLGPAQAAELLQKAPHQAVLGTAQFGIVVPAQHGLEQRVLRGPAGRFKLDILTALQERPDLLQAQGFGLLHDDSHRPQLELGPSEASLPAQLRPLGLYWKRRVSPTLSQEC